MFKVLILYVCLAGIFISNCCAQAKKQYVITTKGDTLTCVFKKGLISRDDNYKLPGTDSYKAVNEKEIKEYQTGYSDNPMVAKRIPKPVNYIFFVEWLERGSINLYKYEYSSTKLLYNAVVYYAARNGSDTLVEVKTNEFTVIGIAGHKKNKSNFRQFIQSDPELLADFDKQNKFGFEDIRKTIHTFNERNRN
jgi:hypothetical protein